MTGPLKKFAVWWWAGCTLAFLFLSQYLRFFTVPKNRLWAHWSFRDFGEIVLIIMVTGLVLALARWGLDKWSPKPKFQASLIGIGVIWMLLPLLPPINSPRL